MGIRDWYWNRQVRRHGFKFGTAISTIGKRATLKLEEGVRMGQVDIDVRGELSIGAHTYIRSDSCLQMVTSIGRFCSIGAGVILGQEKNNHPADWLSTHPFQYTDTAWQYDAHIDFGTVGNDVWIGRDAMVLEGVNVGTGAIIATRALVTQDVPPYAVVAGVPAKLIRYRYSSEMIERLLASKWWERDMSQLKDLPLNDPASCLEQLPQLAPANYRQIQLTCKGCKVLR